MSCICVHVRVILVYVVHVLFFFAMCVLAFCSVVCLPVVFHPDQHQWGVETRCRLCHSWAFHKKNFTLHQRLCGWYSTNFLRCVRLEKWSTKNSIKYWVACCCNWLAEKEVIDSEKLVTRYLTRGDVGKISDIDGKVCCHVHHFRMIICQG